MTTPATVPGQQNTERQHDSTGWKSFAGVSTLLVIPCFWHEFLVCVDLGSHTYNAWMALLIAAGKAPALYITSQKTNVLFDWLLSAMCAYFGYNAGEKIAVAFSVLIFFWGAFAFLTSLAGRRRWDVAAPLAMFAYGWVFQTGLFNYYLSIGLACAALAALWTREKRGQIASLILLPLIMLAHPLGLIVFFGFAIFEWISRKFQTRGMVVAVCLSIAVLVATRFYLASHYWVAYSNRPFWLTTGPDQLVLYAPAYFVIAFASLFFFLTLGIEALDRRWPRASGQREKIVLVASLYLLVKLVIAFLPDQVQWTGATAKASLLVNRATLVTALLLLALMAVLPAHRWKTRAWGVVAALFFVLLYLSSGILSGMQRSAIDTARALPAGARVIASGNWQTVLGVNNPHLAERACIGHCFVINNYEIATNQFRVRARTSSPIIEASLVNNDRMQDGIYVVRSEDLPLFSMHPCSVGRKACVGQFAAGDQNGHPSIELGTAQTPAQR